MQQKESKSAMKLPTIKECHALFDKYHVPSIIREHCVKVSEYATKLAQALKSKGIDVNIDLVQVGALLHDLMKAPTLSSLNGSKQFSYEPTKEEIEMWQMLRKKYEGKFEDEIAYDVLKDDYPKLAEFLIIEGKDGKKENWEEKIVHYIDWRVMGTTLVSLNERMDYFGVRYNRNKEGEKWEELKRIERNSEKDIWNALDMEIDELW